jgi:hypothetical protein
MSNPTVSPHIRSFNERVKSMNQTGSNGLTLSAREARDLQNDLFVLLDRLAALQTVIIDTQNQGIEVSGGRF